MTQRFIQITLLSFFISALTAQDKKGVKALLIEKPLTIDARLSESCYGQSHPATGFFQLHPYNGQPAYQKSEVYIFYDQKNIYVGAMLYDTAPDSIFNYFSERDDIGMSDYFGIYFDPYNQGQLAFGFFITPAGVQTDMKAVKSSHDNEDDNWDAVWQSKTRITENGWIIEMRIPYSALRFPKTSVGNWGLNMFRNIRRYNSNNSWNFIDRKVAGFIHQEGELSGIKNIKPPVRLAISPYAATYLEFKEGSNNADFIYKAGMDLKYGLNESFTLDMMLIPDYGQIQSDNKQLNLSPYEVYYGEKRQFFTEGTELFDRADIFYSRRIGAKPKFSDKAENNLNSAEIVDNLPTETQLVNASKVSGRSKNGWGVGVLNAMSLASYATLKDTLTNAKREMLIQPLTNYNVTAIDKSLKNNSYISLINTNVSMYDNPFTANVTATEFQIRDKKKQFAVSGAGGISHRLTEENGKETGFAGFVEFKKNSGNLHFGIEQSIFDATFNPNDLGYLRRNNELETDAFIFYQIIEPFGVFREWNAAVWTEYTRIYEPSAFFGSEIGIESYSKFTNNHSIYWNTGIQSEKHDYFETRVKGRYYIEPQKVWGNLIINTDNRKRLNFRFHVGGYNHPSSAQSGHWINGRVRYRLGQKLQGYYQVEIKNYYNDYGYADRSENEDSIFFTKRDVSNFENTLGLTYGISNKATITMRGRHYNSAVHCHNAFLLNSNGTLASTSKYQFDNQTYNAFNIDMTFRWIFAPGSELSLAWKNAIYKDEELLRRHYWKNLKQTWQSDQTNTFSLKVLYYIDYNNLVKQNRR